MVFLTPFDFATKHDMILVSEFPVTEINASILEMFSSSSNPTLRPSPLITKAFGKSSANSNAISLLLSTIFTLNLLTQRSLAVFFPILLPPKIITFLTSDLTFPDNSNNSSSPPFEVINTTLSPSLNCVSPRGIMVYWVPKR